MSAIAGIFDLEGKDVSRSDLEKMSRALAHRGPDGSRIWTEGPCGMAYLHFEADADSGPIRQPLVRDGVALAIDGAIDGQFAENSAQMLFQTYAREKEKTPVVLSGEFSFVVWDMELKRLMLARDVFGIHALYYALYGRRLFFATEAKAILEVPGFPRRPDPIRTKEFRDFRFRPVERTFFEGIQRLPAAEVLIADSSGARRQRYWGPDPMRSIRLPDRRAYEDQFRGIFFEAVRSRLPSSGTAAFTLSGGLDSSSVLSVAAKIQQEERPGLELAAFSFRSRKYVDESPYIRMVLDQYPSIKHRYVYFEDVDPMNELEKMIRAQESPVYDLIDAYFYHLYAKIRESGAKIVLQGEWGDQVLTGSAYLIDLLRRGALREFWRELHLLPPNGGGSFEEIFKRNIWYLLLPCRIQDRYEGCRYLFWRTVLPFKRWEELGPKFPHASQRELYDGVFGTLNQMMLETLDRGTAFTGVAARMPFLDRRLLDFLFAIPGEERIRDGLCKQILRHALRGVLPDGIARRNGKGDFTDLMLDRYRAYGFGAASVEEAGRLWNEKVFGIWEEAWIKKTRKNTSSPSFAGTAV